MNVPTKFQAKRLKQTLVIVEKPDDLMKVEIQLHGPRICNTVVFCAVFVKMSNPIAENLNSTR